jgi:hypothetical protein
MTAYLKVNSCMEVLTVLTYRRVPLQSFHGSHLHAGDTVDECFKLLHGDTVDEELELLCGEVGDIMTDETLEPIGDFIFGEELDHMAAARLTLSCHLIIAS